jgi:hypothetical protein
MECVQKCMHSFFRIEKEETFDSNEPEKDMLLGLANERKRLSLAFKTNKVLQFIWERRRDI